MRHVISRCHTGVSYTGYFGDAGATAFDPEDGDLTPRILTCPPDGCMPFNCPGHELLRKGIQGCGADTDTAAVGTLIKFDFVVMDLSVPPVVTRATRLVRVVSPCAASETYCPDLEPPHDCGSSACSTRATLLAAEPPPPEPPYLNFTAALPPALIGGGAVARAPASHTDVPASLFDAVTQSGVTAIAHVAVRCGAAMPVPLALCAAPGDPDRCTVDALHAEATSATAGWVFSVSPVPDPSCTTERMQSGQCAACSPEAALIGGCLPGAYVFVFDAQAPNGMWSGDRLAVAVRVRAAVVTGEVGVRVAVRTTARNSSSAGDDAAADAWLEHALASGQSGLSEVALAAASGLAEALAHNDGECDLGPFQSATDVGSVVVEPGTASSNPAVVSSAQADGGSLLTVSPPKRALLVLLAATYHVCQNSLGSASGRVLLWLCIGCSRLWSRCHCILWWACHAVREAMLLCICDRCSLTGCVFGFQVDLALRVSLTLPTIADVEERLHASPQLSPPPPPSAAAPTAATTTSAAQPTAPSVAQCINSIIAANNLTAIPLTSLGPFLSSRPVEYPSIASADMTVSAGDSAEPFSVAECPVSDGRPVSLTALLQSAEADSQQATRGFPELSISIGVRFSGWILHALCQCMSAHRAAALLPMHLPVHRLLKQQRSDLCLCELHLQRRRSTGAESADLVAGAARSPGRARSGREFLQLDDGSCTRAGPRLRAVRHGCSAPVSGAWRGYSVIRCLPGCRDCLCQFLSEPRVSGVICGHRVERIRRKHSCR